MKACILESIREKCQILQKGFAFCFALAAFALVSACAVNVNTATPDKPIQPTAEIVKTVQPSPTAEPTETPTAEPTLSPSERNYEWTDEEAVTVRLDATEEKVQEALERSRLSFPLRYYEDEGVYGIFCLIESISYLKEGHYVPIGDFDIRVTAQCSYLDGDDEKQTVTVALVIENRKEGTSWTPKFETEMGTYAPYFIQEFFETAEDIKPGSVINVVFGLPNEVNQNIEISTEGAVHHGAAMGQLHSAEEISAYITNGNPEMLGDPLILSFSSQPIPLYSIYP